MNGDIVLKQIQVHPKLLEEFSIMKIELEKTTGYPIRGGNPVISLIVADLLKKRRENKINGKKENVRIEVTKVKGCKKNSISFL